MSKSGIRDEIIMFTLIKKMNFYKLMDESFDSWLTIILRRHAGLHKRWKTDQE